MSRSIVTRLSLRRSSRSSSRSSVVRPLRLPASMSCCAIHRLSDSVDTPISLAMSRIDLSELR